MRRIPYVKAHMQQIQDFDDVDIREVLMERISQRFLTVHDRNHRLASIGVTAIHFLSQPKISS
jgi:hypothetical protein